MQKFVVDRAAQTCVNEACWKLSLLRRTGKYRYKDEDNSSDGISQIEYKWGKPRRGSAKAKGSNDTAKGHVGLPTGVVPLLSGNTAPTIQMITNDGFCVGATMNAVKKDDGLRYKVVLW